MSLGAKGKAPLDRRRVVSSIVLLRRRTCGLQMRGLEIISASRCNGWGPDGSLKMLWIFSLVDVGLHGVRSLTGGHPPTL